MRRYRRTCLDAYNYRRERSLGYVNNGGMLGNVWTGFGPLQMSEGWSEYAVGQLQVTGPPNWNASVGTGHGEARTDGTSIVKANVGGVAAGLTESIVWQNLSGTQIDWTKALRWTFSLSTLSAANNLTFQLGSNQLSYSSGSVNVAGTVFPITSDALLHQFDVRMNAKTGGGARVSTVYMDGTLLGNSAAFDPSIGAGSVITIGTFFNQNAVNPPYTFGPIRFYATHI